MSSKNTPKTATPTEGQTNAPADVTLDAEAAAKAAAEKAEQDRLEAEQLAVEKAEVERREAEAAAAAAAAKQPSKTDPLVEVAPVEAGDERRAKAGVQRYRTVHGGTLVDPETLKVFGPEGTKSKLTGWMEYQIQNGKLELEPSDEE